MVLFRKAYSVVGLVLVIDLVAQFFLIGAAVFTIFNEASNGSGADRALNDSGVYLIAHAINGGALAVLILVVCVGWRLIRILQVRGRWRGKTVVLRRVAGWRLRRIRRMLRRRVGIALRCIATE